MQSDTKRIKLIAYFKERLSYLESNECLNSFIKEARIAIPQFSFIPGSGKILDLLAHAMLEGIKKEYQNFILPALEDML